MTPAVLALTPAAIAPALLLAPARRLTTTIVAATSFLLGGLALFVAFAHGDPGPVAYGYLRVDPLARLFLAFTNLLQFGIAAYVWNRVRATPELAPQAEEYGVRALLFIAASNYVVLSNHLLASWVALEASSLVLMPLIARDGAPAARRAAWRYLLFSLVGLGLAFLGLLCLGRSQQAAGLVPTYFQHELTARVTEVQDTWQRLGLALLCLGYGTKLGLAPMYSWLPETYDEAPPAVAATLGAIQFNAALACLLRVLQAFPVERRPYLSHELLALGLASMTLSTTSIVATRNYKRLIAYASINHAGVIAIGLALGRRAAYGVVLYLVSNAFIKALLFLTAGRIKAHYGTKDTRAVAGLIKDLPYSGLFLMVGTFALLGFPPFGSFLGELLVLSGLVRAGQLFVFVVFCANVATTFVATGRTIFPMIWGAPKREVHWPRQTFLSALPKLSFFVALVALGIYIPAPVARLFRAVAASLGVE
jgi:hydrogenase-4 component F